MPGYSGWDLARRSKALYPNRPVVLVTAWGDDLEDNQPGLIDGVLPKPYSSRDLSALLQKLKLAG